MVEERNTLHTFRLREWYKLNSGYRFSLQLWTVDGYIDIIDQDDNIIFHRYAWDAEKWLHYNWKGSFQIDSGD
jgi:hypothetical protein